ncbi:MAG: cytochrome c oxidase assembly protein [Gammaproteobacteria bacterium]|nr:cytochrome c oxidase assembly protein [Gammaproteobacteria bacterium]
MSEAVTEKENKLLTRLVLVVVAMFGFGFALVPLYDVFCEITGLNGKTSDEQYVVTGENRINHERWVTVQFLANNNAGLPWQFRPVVRSLRVNPGEAISTSFYLKNTENRNIVAQAVPSVAPYYAANYFHKTECFCFEQQALAAGEEKDMPLRFIVDTELPEEVTTLTLSYTLFDITETVKEIAAGGTK